MEDVVSFLTSEPVSDESETVSPVSVVSDDVTYTDPSIAKIESLEERNAILMTELSELEVFVQQIDELQKDLNATQEKLRGLETENYQLYIGCHPHRLSVIYADELFHVLQVKVAEIANVPHYALLEYGEGPKRVASLLRQQLASGALKLPLRLVIDRRNPCADACLDVLIPLYRNCGGQIIERMG